MNRRSLALASLVIAASAASVHAANPKIDKDAVQPYKQKDYPKFFAEWGAAGMKRVNELMPKAAEKVAASPECDSVDLVELSGNRSAPGKKVVFFVDCKNSKRFYVDEADLKSDAIPESKQAKSAKFTDTAATEACEKAVKAQLHNPLTFNRKSASVYRAPGGNVVIEFLFEAKNNLGGVLPSKARCVATDRGLEEAVISKS